MLAVLCGVGIRDLVRDFGPMLALVGVAMTLYVNGVREERRRRRETHARALEAVAAYYEMPFLIRRRRDDEPAAERARLSEKFASIQAELASCEALIRADRDSAVRTAYADLVEVLRATAGEEASRAWDAEPLSSDKQMRMKDVADALSPISEPRRICEHAMATSVTWRPQRLSRAPRPTPSEPRQSLPAVSHSSDPGTPPETR